MKFLSVQKQHLGLAEISAGVARLRDGRPHAVLEVQGITFSMLGEEQQEALLASFARLLNALPCAVQFLVDVRPVDLEPRLDRLVRIHRDGAQQVPLPRRLDVAEQVGMPGRMEAGVVHPLQRHRAIVPNPETRTDRLRLSSTALV